MRQRQIATGAGALLAMLLCPPLASAHLVTTGMGPVYDGIGHLLLTPEDLVPVFAFAIYVGMRGPAHSRKALFLLPVAWLAGGIGGLFIQAAPQLPIATLTFLLVGGFVAADLHLPERIVAVVAIALGMVHGLLNGIALGGGPGVSGLLGISAAIFVLVALVAGFAVSLQRPWMRIAARVAGSWVVAIGVLMIGWRISGQG